MSRRKATPKAHPEHAKRRQPLGVSSLWTDVPDDVILTIVRDYASMGDAVMFGTSADRAVCSIRVYRNGTPYSTYFRGLHDLPAALERLDKFMPAMRTITVATLLPDTAVQVKSTPNVAPPSWITIVKEIEAEGITGEDERIREYTRRAAAAGILKT